MEQQPGGSDPRFILATLVNGKWTIVAVALLAIAAASISNYFQTLRYQAAAQIQINAPPFLPSPGQDLTAQSSYYSNVDRYFNTEQQKLDSRRMKTLFAEEIRRKNPALQNRSVESVADELDLGFRVEPVQDTNLVSLFLIAETPEKAAEWLNLYADLFVAENARLQEENVRQSRELLRAQLDEIKNLLAAQQGQTAQYAGNLGAGPVPAGDPELVLRYQTAYEDARRKRIEGENNLGRLEPFLKPGSDLTGLPDLEYPDVLRSYLARLGETRATLDNLRLDGKGEEHPQVLARKAEAGKLEDQIRVELKKSADGLSLDIAVLRKAEDGAMQNYREAVAQRKTSSRQSQEMARLEKMIGTWTDASALVEDKLRSLKVMESYVTNNISVVERARPDSEPVSRRGPVFVLLLGFCGAVIGGMIVIGGELLNPKIKTVEEIQSALSVPALGFLPRSADFGLNEISEAYNVLRTELLFRRDTRQQRTIMITSSVPQEGKTTVTLNLAKTLAAAGDRTIVVDFDLRKARLRALLSTGNQDNTGVFSPVDGLNLRIEPTETRCLHLLVPAALPQNPPILLSQPEVRELIHSLRERYDWVLIDTPPITSVTDGVIIAPLADTVLFVIKHNHVDKRIVRNSLAALTNVKADVMGAVLNDIDVKKMSYYSYQSYYRYYNES